MNFGKTTRACGLMLGVAYSLLFPSLVLAADPEIAPQSDFGAADDTVLFWGADLALRGDSTGFGLDAGFVTAINGDLSTSGWTVSGTVGFSNTDEPASDSQAFYGALLAGYQWHVPDFYFSLAGGVNVINNDETPGGGPTDGTEVGFIAQYGFETKRENAFYAQSYGAYSTAYDQIYAHLKAGYKGSQLRYGPELTVFADESSDPTFRFGAFVGDIPVTDKLSMVVSAGYQLETEANTDDGFYATVGFSVPFSLR